MWKVQSFVWLDHFYKCSHDSKFVLDVHVKLKKDLQKNNYVSIMKQNAILFDQLKLNSGVSLIMILRIFFFNHSSFVEYF